MDTLATKLRMNALRDCQRAPIDPKDRARIIQELLDHKGMSIRSLATELNMPRATLQDWQMWNKLDQKKYDELKQAGTDDKAIYQALRTGHNVNTSDPDAITQHNFEVAVQRSVISLRPYATKRIQHSKTAYDAITELKDVARRLEARMMTRQGP